MGGRDKDGGGSGVGKNIPEAGTAPPEGVRRSVAGCAQTPGGQGEKKPEQLKWSKNQT